MNKKKKVVNTSMYPDEVIERLARCFYPSIFFRRGAPFGVRLFLFAIQTTRHRLARPAFWYDFGQGTAPRLNSPKKTKNPNPSPIGKGSDFSLALQPRQFTVVAAAFVLRPQCLGWLVRALLSAWMRKQIQRLKKQTFDSIV